MADINKTVELPSPAKVNLMLSVHGRRADGFHLLTSLVVGLEFGDRLQLTLSSKQADSLFCDESGVPTDDKNLILRAAVAFREQTGKAYFFDFKLKKRIPMGAGLGGGSSNASVALRGMNQLVGDPLSHATLLSMAADLGSDCPFFVDAVPALMQGRGEILTPLAKDQADYLRGRRIVLFRPRFAVETAWAYQQLVANSPDAYESKQQAQARLDHFFGADQPLFDDLLFNSFESIVGRKFLAIPCLLERLREQGVNCLMSGSGSCCFALLDDSKLAESEIHEMCRNAWGASAFWVVTSIC